jgi:tol-pal system protein YbgF
MKNQAIKAWRQCVKSSMLLLAVTSAQAGLFDDDEARRAILDLRQRIEAVRIDTEQRSSRANEDSTVTRRSLLDLQGQIDLLRADVAKLRGLNEQLARDLAESQRQQKDVSQGLIDRFRQFEPVKVTVDGSEFLADPAEKRAFEAALAVFRKGDFAASQVSFLELTRRYPESGYRASALFWLGNAQYATRDYKEAMANFRILIAKAPEHLRSPEAVLSIANCQLELKDTKGARKTLEDLVTAYPQSEAAVAAKDRLARLK